MRFRTDTVGDSDIGTFIKNNKEVAVKEDMVQVKKVKNKDKVEYKMKVVKGNTIRDQSEKIFDDHE